MDDQTTNMPVEGEAQPEAGIASPRAGEETEKKSCGCEECKCDPCECEKPAEAEGTEEGTPTEGEAVEEKPAEEATEQLKSFLATNNRLIQAVIAYRDNYLDWERVF